MSIRATIIRGLTATVLAAGATLGIAGTANALPISTIQSECQQANGTFGYYYVGSYFYGYQCVWSGGGTRYRDIYDRAGDYIGTDVVRGRR